MLNILIYKIYIIYYISIIYNIPSFVESRKGNKINIVRKGNKEK